MRHEAWLNTVPEKKQHSRRQMFSDANPSHPALEMPEAGIYSHLIGYLHECGTYSSNGMGPVPLNWPEIKAWSDLCQPCLEPWEAQAIRRLSSEYVMQLSKSGDPLCEAPYQTKAAVMSQAERVDSGFRELAKIMKAIRAQKEGKKTKTQP